MPYRVNNISLWLDEPDHQLRVVHAGVIPGVAIEEQTERTLLYLRCIDADATMEVRMRGMELEEVTSEMRAARDGCGLRRLPGRGSGGV